MSHHAPQTCIECNYESSEADAYLRHYLRDHSNLCPYTCTHCKDIFISEEELKAHICRKQPKIDENDDKIETIEISSYQHRISMALKALPPLPTRDKMSNGSSTISHLPNYPLHFLVCNPAPVQQPVHLHRVRNIRHRLRPCLLDGWYFQAREIHTQSRGIQFHRDDSVQSSIPGTEARSESYVDSPDGAGWVE
ncbi:hypothetical protein BDZ45DRAFT_808195 [Acephala macrosclerotiorum]|nr:hypothetical protein BDZ45DRAFT_808195 [Acephala macrosclerotiorum]